MIFRYVRTAYAGIEISLGGKGQSCSRGCWAESRRNCRSSPGIAGGKQAEYNLIFWSFMQSKMNWNGKDDE